jgi:hypothetical protein
MQSAKRFVVQRNDRAELPSSWRYHFRDQLNWSSQFAAFVPAGAGHDANASSLAASAPEVSIITDEFLVAPERAFLFVGLSAYGFKSASDGFSVNSAWI